jgi:hypothetical protein
MNIYSKLRELARSIRIQNLFVAVKEINGMRLFCNEFDFSKLQEIYLSYLYNSNAISNDIILEKISEHVFDSEIMEDAYLIWKRKNMKKINIKEDKQKNVNLVVGKKINFPIREK